MREINLVMVCALLVGCAGRTGKIGTPIAQRFSSQLSQLSIGKTTVEELKQTFAPKPLALKESKIIDGKKVEIWQLARGGSMDAAAFIMWGYVAYDKDQEILFTFENGVLVSFESIVIPDPPAVVSPPARSPKNS